MGLPELHSGSFYQALLRGVARAKTKEALARAFANSPLAVMVTDRRGVIQYVNERFSKLTDFHLDEIRGLTPRVLKSSEIPPETFHELWETLLSGHEWHGEFRNRKKNGECYWEFSSIWPLTGPNGRTDHFLAIKTDITRRKAEVTEQQQKIAALQKASDPANNSAGLLCLCAWCHSVRDRSGAWTRVDSFLTAHLRAGVTHGICPECESQRLSGLKSPSTHLVAYYSEVGGARPHAGPSHWGINE